MRMTSPLVPPVHVLVMSDYRYAAELLAHRLCARGDMRVVSIERHPAGALNHAGRERVDIAVLDMDVLDSDGVQLTRELLSRDPRTRVIGLSRFIESHYPWALLELGARGFMSHTVSAAELLDAIQRVARGDLAISPEVARHLATTTDDTRGMRRVRKLTDKEHEVLRLLSDGRSVGEIADELGVTIKTVQSHRSNMKRKLAVKSDVELCLAALRAGVTRVR